MLAALEKEDCSRGRNITVRPRYLSLGETVVLAGIDDKVKCVRNDLDDGIWIAPRVYDMNRHHMGFNWPYVIACAAVYRDDWLADCPPLRKATFEKVLVAVSDDPVMDTWNFANMTVWHKTILNCTLSDKLVDISRFVQLHLGRVCEEVRPRVDLYAAGLERVDENPSVLGGRAVFKGTRLSVNHVGMMIDNGEAVTNILEDYPHLTEGDVRFAVLYNKARPLVGRPKASGSKNEIHAR